MAETYTYDKNTDYQKLINDAVAKGDWEAAKVAETQRNAKIRGEGLNYEQTYNYQTAPTATSFEEEKKTTTTTPAYTQPEMSSEYTDALNNVLNFKEFSYDTETDPLYQSYKDQYTRNGQTASNNTLAQVSARTGGLASSYAGQAAQQTYNNYMQALNDKVPELYSLAYSKYMDEFTMAQNKLSAASSYDDTLYSRNLDTYNINYQAEQDAYNREQTEYQNALEMAQMAAQYGDYSGLNGLGIDTSAMTAKKSGSGGKSSTTTTTDTDNYTNVISTDMWKQITEKARESKSDAASLLNSYWDVLTTPQRNVLARIAGYSSADIVKNGNVTKTGAESLAGWYSDDDNSTDNPIVSSISSLSGDPNKAHTFLMNYGINKTPLTAEQWQWKCDNQPSSTEAKFGTYDDYVRSFVYSEMSYYGKI